MKDERREGNSERSERERFQNERTDLPRGPVSRAVGWLANKFDRTQLSKREAEERRKRYL